MQCPHCGKGLQVTIQRGDYAKAHKILKDARAQVDSMPSSKMRTELQQKIDSALDIVGAEIAIGLSKM